MVHAFSGLDSHIFRKALLDFLACVYILVLLIDNLLFWFLFFDNCFSFLQVAFVIRNISFGDQDSLPALLRYRSFFLHTVFKHEISIIAVATFRLTFNIATDSREMPDFVTVVTLLFVYPRMPCFACYVLII